MEIRIERDFLGEHAIPKERYYGIHTARAIENFGEFRNSPVELILSIVELKLAAAIVNRDNGFLASNKAQAIIEACQTILEGSHWEEFCVSSLQGGAGTSTHMNVNEVLANLAIETLGGNRGNYSLIHPNDDVNRFQSTNDVYPSALKIASLRLLQDLANELANLQTALQEKERLFSEVLKTGRTEMQDAVPITLGQEFSAYAEAIARDRWRVFKSMERLRTVNLGGTAVGTGINAPKIFIFKWIEEIRRLTNLPVTASDNRVDTTQNADVFAEVSGILKTVAVNYIKISGDLRLLSSGPKAALGEIELPPRQAGSSIMPKKINPVMPEWIAQIGIQVIASDSAITTAASMGQLELNAFLPLIAQNLIDSIKLLTIGARNFRLYCIEGIRANEARCRKLLEESLCFATLLAPYVGYDIAGQIAETAEKKGITVREAAILSQHFTESELDSILTPRKVTSPGIAGADILKDRLKL